jgi:hypothetical protein
MRNTVKLRAEEQFAAIQKKAKQTLTEKEEAQQENREHTVSLRALRLAKEVADKEAADKEATTKNNKPSRLPQGH